MIGTPVSCWFRLRRVGTNNPSDVDLSNGYQIMIYDLDLMKEYARIQQVSNIQTILLMGWAANSNIIGYRIQSTVNKMPRKSQYLYNMRDKTNTIVPETDSFRNLSGTVINGGLIAWINGTSRYVSEE